jgi:transcriptional antiterminator RfaH
LQNLEFQAFRTFWPRFWKTRRHSRRQDIVLAALFPNYIFVILDEQHQHWRQINGTFAVKRVVQGAGGRPVSMPRPIMDHILARCDGGIMTSILDEFQPGRTVKVLNGPFADRLVTIEHLDADGRVRVLLDILGGQSTLALSKSNLSPV